MDKKQIVTYYPTTPHRPSILPPYPTGVPTFPIKYLMGILRVFCGRMGYVYITFCNIVTLTFGGLFWYT